ncbi:MAG: ABC transporter permease subunit [Candidatus Hadarchaeum sp.]|uniref:ABC transporter permease subunit n=1 Tax=Candidatus Hadarchaeum sp. TaxID=2883567 RepID=UPI003D0B2747
MKFDRIWEIAKKDMASVRRYRYVLYGLVVMPLIFAIVVPVVSLLPILNAESLSGGELPPFATPGYSLKQATVMGMVSMLSLFFMFIPAFVPSVIASYTFVGEKINKQLEPLLVTPTTDSELLLGKALGAFLPAVGVTFASFVGMVVLVDLLTFPLFGFLLLPNLISLTILFIYCPLIAILSVSVSVFISSKVNDVRAAMQLSGVTTVPVLGFYFLFLGGFLRLDWVELALFAALLIFADLGLIYLSKRTFQREEILTKWK